MSASQLRLLNNEEGNEVDDRDEYQMEFDRLPLSTKYSEIATMIQRSVRCFSLFLDQITWAVLPPWRIANQMVLEMGKKVHALKVDQVEMAFLCAIFLFDKSNYYEYKELFLDALAWFIQSKRMIHM
ncbi:hypothetical protein HELRODRAFT_194209 [Helobdella robusta]|uniref:Uncharacterized protein n=1 Tax=Helobdella robusta TaxID=6412 RepID=T1FVT3_HELRO|nr:hypothetical protein HELRODRAFT_194209 [Helobdella robusta]ESN92490.1 hypothetical protein HELRODRAFT_194209 [Helobdella robusta]